MSLELDSVFIRIFIYIINGKIVLVIQALNIMVSSIIKSKHEEKNFIKFPSQKRIIIMIVKK